MKKVLTVSLTLFLLVLVAIVLLVNSFGGKLVHKVVTVAGPAALGVPVTLAQAEFNLVRGNLRLKELKVGNPKGFKTDSLFELDTLEVALNMRALLAGEVHLRKIIMDAPAITYERGLTASNLSTLLAYLEKTEQTNPGEEKNAEPKPEAGENRSGRVVIDELAITGSRLKVSLTLAQGFSAPVPLPPIILKDIGKESDGVTFLEVIRMVLRAILGSVGGVLKGSTELVGDGAGLVGEGVMAVGEVGVAGSKAVGNGAAAVGGAVVDGASVMVDGLGGLFKKNEPKEETKEE